MKILCLPEANIPKRVSKVSLKNEIYCFSEVKVFFIVSNLSLKVAVMIRQHFNRNKVLTCSKLSVVMSECHVLVFYSKLVKCPMFEALLS